MAWFRKSAGVVDSNNYLFARSHYGGEGHIRGSDVMRVWSERVGARQPQLLRSTKLRKHIATVSQIVNLKENELDILAKFMGHDINIHREFYRLPEETLEVARVSKLLLALENEGDLAGKTLEDIVITPEDGKTS